MRLAMALGVVGLGTGCHSAYVEATIRNGTERPISLVELDYPSASLGTQTLGVGEEFHYRFKVLGSGAVKLLYTDAAHKEVTVAGPELREGDEGSLRVEVTGAGVAWAPVLRGRK